MKNLMGLLLMVSFVASATTFKPDETTTEADGRGVGGGISHIRDAFQLMSKDIVSIVSASKLQRTAHVNASLDTIDTKKIVEITRDESLLVVSTGSSLVLNGAAVNSDGRLVLSKEFWENELLKVGHQRSMIRVLLQATGHEEALSDIVSEIYELWLVREESRKLELEYNDSFGRF